MSEDGWKKQIEEKIDSLEKENKKLRQKTQRLEKQNIKLRKQVEEKSEDSLEKIEEGQLSRRSFLKKLGAGALGLGALGVSPAASQLTISKTGILRDGSPEFLDLSGSSPMISNLDMGGNAINSVNAVSSDGTELYLNTNGSPITAYDNTNGQRVLQAKEGGNVLVPNGILYNQGNQVATRTWSNSNLVNASGDSMSGRLTMNTNDLYFQPGSSGGTTTALTFESNTNSGSDYAYINFHDDYYGNGESAALELNVINDSGTSAGPDSIVLNASGMVDASGSTRFRLPHRSSDPAASAGDMWYRTDLD